MSSDPLTDDLLSDDTSKMHWRRRANNNLTKDEALLGIPTHTPICTKIRIEAWRAFHAFCQARQVSIAAYVRTAVGEALTRDGFDPRHLDSFR